MSPGSYWLNVIVGDVFPPPYIPPLSARLGLTFPRRSTCFVCPRVRTFSTRSPRPPRRLVQEHHRHLRVLAHPLARALADQRHRRATATPPTNRSTTEQPL